MIGMSREIGVDVQTVPLVGQRLLLVLHIVRFGRLLGEA